MHVSSVGQAMAVMAGHGVFLLNWARQSLGTMKAKIAVDAHEIWLATAFSMVWIPKALTVFNPFSASLEWRPQGSFLFWTAWWTNVRRCLEPRI